MAKEASQATAKRTSLKESAFSAAKRILNGKSNPYDKEGFWFKDKQTGRYGVTDSFCMVMYDSYVLCVNDVEDSPIDVNASKLFEPFNDGFHEWYSDDRMDNIPVSEIVKTCKEAKKDKNGNPEWHRRERHGIYFNVNLMRDACEALGCKTVCIYYPFKPFGSNTQKPIVIIGETGMGLVMPLR